MGSSYLTSMKSGIVCVSMSLGLKVMEMINFRKFAYDEIQDGRQMNPMGH